MSERRAEFAEIREKLATAVADLALLLLDAVKNMMKLEEVRVSDLWIALVKAFEFARDLLDDEVFQSAVFAAFYDEIQERKLLQKRGGSF